MPENYKLENGYIIGPEVNLSGADLSGKDLYKADLSNADLTSNDLSILI